MEEKSAQLYTKLNNTQAERQYSVDEVLPSLLDAVQEWEELKTYSNASSVRSQK